MKMTGRSRYWSVTACDQFNALCVPSLCRGPSGGQAHEIGIKIDGGLGPACAAVLVLVALPGLVPDRAGGTAFHEQRELDRGPGDAVIQGRVTPVFRSGEQ